jgi:copper chaperone NosL
MFKKSIFLFLASMFLVFGSLNAEEFVKSATIKPELTQTGSQKEWCPVCGMNIEAFYKTSHAAKVHNHKNRQYCSMRCLAVDMQEHKINSDDIKVVDSSTQKLISAKSAFYVVGSDVQGTMSKVSKIAFAAKEAAEEFNIEHGGKVVDFKTAMKMAQDSLSSDVEMVEMKKRKQVHPMGEKIFLKNCKNSIDINSHLEINELKANLKNNKLCGDLKEGELQALSLYLWEVKRFGDVKSSDAIKVTKDEKCPICGMFVYKYPKWVAQIHYAQNHLSFDGVKDMMKYYFKNQNGIKSMLVSEYYSQKSMDAKTAYFVLGSDIYGPMGNELIPFSNLKDAKTFSMDHKGKKVLKFDEIKKEDIYKLDE